MSKNSLQSPKSANECNTTECAACKLSAAIGYEWTADKPLPIYADRKTCAAIVTHFLFPVMPRTLATWPLVARKPNRTVIYKVAEVLEYANKRFDEAYHYKQA